MTSTRTVLVIGADAAGMSAAHQILRAAQRTGSDLRVVAVDRGDHTSYSACGIPYWIAGEVDSGDDLVARSADAHREAGIDLRMRTEAVAVDLDARTVTLRDQDGAEERLTYDDLVLATGASPVVPDFAFCDAGPMAEGTGPVKTIDDGHAWLDRMAADDGDVLIVGGGYIGLEMSEAVLARGRRCTVLTRGRVMHALDPEMGARVRDTMIAAGVEVHEHAEVTDLDTTDNRVCAAITRTDRVPANLVVLALGVTPNTGLVADQGLELGDSGGLRPDPRGVVDADRGVWAAGDCCEVRHRVTGDWDYIALGTLANKQGRALGAALADQDSGLRFDGGLGTAITRFSAGEHYLEIGLTGLGEEAATARGFDVLALTTEGTMASGYMPEAEQVAIRVVAERGTRRLLGVQIVGGHGAGKRIDTAAAVLWYAGTVDDLAWMDLSYAPPFATAWEILQVAARRVAERL